MNKSEFIDHISSEHDCTKAEAEKIINIFTGSVTSALGAGKEIALVGFGSFGVSDIAAKNGRNPKTGETMTIAAYKHPKFKAGKGLKDVCNGRDKK